MANSKEGSPITTVGDDGGGNFFKVRDHRIEDGMGDEFIFKLGLDSSAWPQNDKFGGDYQNDEPGVAQNDNVSGNEGRVWEDLQAGYGWRWV